MNPSVSIVLNCGKRPANSNVFFPEHKRSKLDPVDHLSSCPSLLHILSYLDRTDIVSCLFVNRRIRSVVQNNPRSMPKEKIEIVLIKDRCTRCDGCSFSLFMKQERTGYKMKKMTIISGRVETDAIPGNLFRKLRSCYIGGSTLLETLQFTLISFLKGAQLERFAMENMDIMSQNELTLCSETLKQFCKTNLDYFRPQKNIGGDYVYNLANDLRCCLVLHRVNFINIIEDFNCQNFGSRNIVILTENPWLTDELNIFIDMWLENSFSIDTISVQLLEDLGPETDWPKLAEQWNNTRQILPISKIVEHAEVTRRADGKKLWFRYVKRLHELQFLQI